MLVTLGGQRVNIYPQWRKTTYRQDVYDLNCSYVICTALICIGFPYLSPLRTMFKYMHAKRRCDNPRLTVYSVHIISPRSSLAIPTPIGSSILSVSHVSSWTCSAPSLMLNSKSSVTKPQSNEGTTLNGFLSLSIISFHYWVTTVHSWDSTATSVFEASDWLDC